MYPHRLWLVGPVQEKYMLRPSHTTTETTKMSSSSLHTTTFFHKCNDFSTVYIWATIFTTIFFGKIVVKIFVVCEGLWTYKCLPFQWLFHTKLCSQETALSKQLNMKSSDNLRNYSDKSCFKTRHHTLKNPQAKGYIRTWNILQET